MFWKNNKKLRYLALISSTNSIRSQSSEMMPLQFRWQKKPQQNQVGSHHIITKFSFSLIVYSLKSKAFSKKTEYLKQQWVEFHPRKEREREKWVSGTTISNRAGCVWSNGVASGSWLFRTCWRVTCMLRFLWGHPGYSWLSCLSLLAWLGA